MNTKGKIDFTKTDNIQFIEEVASEISKEDKNWQWEAREIKQHSLLLWWEYLEDEKQEGFRIEYDEAEEVFSVYDEWDNDITYKLEDTAFCQKRDWTDRNQKGDSYKRLRIHNHNTAGQDTSTGY